MELSYWQHLQLFFLEGFSKLKPAPTQRGGCKGKNWDNTLLFVLWQKMVHLLWLSACNSRGLNEASSIFLAMQPATIVSSTPKAWTAALSILNNWLFHLCYMPWDIMQMSRLLASRPHCSLPVIRHDYALLAANASSANKFTMAIIISRPGGTRWGQGGGQV